MIIIPWIYIYYYKWFSVQSTNDYENLILDESEKRIRFFNINRCTSIDFVELLKLEFHLISPSIRMYRNAISNHRAHVSTTYVIYRTVHCVTGSTRVCTNGTGNDWHDCNVRDIGNGDTRYPEQSTPPSVRGCYTIDTNCRLWKCRDTLCKVQRFTAGTSTCHQVSNLSLSRPPSPALQPLFTRNPLL